MRRAFLDPLRRKASLAAVGTARHTLEFDVAEKLVRSKGNDSLRQQALLRPHLVSLVGALPFPSVPPICSSNFEVTCLELTDRGNPVGLCILGSAHEQTHLEADRMAVLHEWERRSKSLRRSRCSAEEPFGLKEWRDGIRHGEWQVPWKVDERRLD